MDQRALSRKQSRRETNLFRATLVSSRRAVHKFIAEHRFLAFGFRSSAPSLVAGRISRPNGPAALGLGGPINVRQPRLERLGHANAPGGDRARGSQTARRALRFELDATGQAARRRRAILRPPCVTSSL